MKHQFLIVVFNLIFSKNYDWIYVAMKTFAIFFESDHETFCASLFIWFLITLDIRICLRLIFKSEWVVEIEFISVNFILYYCYIKTGSSDWKSENCARSKLFIIQIKCTVRFWVLFYCCCQMKMKRQFLMKMVKGQRF